MITTGDFHTTPKMREYVNDILDSGRISYGKYSQAFEQEFARLHGCKYGILSSSGTSSLHVALQAMKEVGHWERAQVIVPATTFVATANIVLHNDMLPVFVDVDRDTFNLDPNLLEQAITPRTRAIIPVHLLGRPCDQRVFDIARQHKLGIIEDSCECMFVGDVGHMGDIACFSTYVAHLIVTGVGGIATTNDPNYAAKMRSLVNHGLELAHLNPDENFAPRPMPNRRFRFDSIGHSFRLTELEAALGLAQLGTHEEMLFARRMNAGVLHDGLLLLNADYGDIFYIQPFAYSESAYMMYPIVLLDSDKEPLMAHLNSKGIETRDLLPLINQPAFAYLNRKDFPVSDWLIRSAFYVGVHQGLTTNDMQTILDAIEEYIVQTQPQMVKA